MDAEAYVDTLPWLIFLVIDRQSGLDVAWASGWAALAAVGLAAWSYWRGRRSPVLDMAIGIFTVCFAVALAVPDWDHLVTEPRAAAVLALSAAALVSLGFQPITVAYTSPMVVTGSREDPRFERVNVEMTLGWGVGAFLVATACWAGRFVRGSIGLTLCEWVIPLALAVATSLWAMRRWELFRLSTDTVPSLGQSTSSRASTSGASSTTREVPGGTAQHAAPEAVIRYLPLRREEMR